MKSLDTNVLARFFIDDPDDAQAALQCPAAIAAFSELSMVTVTVILEFEWVMRGFYGFGAGRYRAGDVRASRDRPHHHRGSQCCCRRYGSLQYRQDLADALHLVRSNGAAKFVTFYREFAKRAESLGSCPAVELLT